MENGPIFRSIFENDIKKTKKVDWKRIEFIFRPFYPLPSKNVKLQKTYYKILTTFFLPELFVWDVPWTENLALNSSIVATSKLLSPEPEWLLISISASSIPASLSATNLIAATQSSLKWKQM